MAPSLMVILSDRWRSGEFSNFPFIPFYCQAEFYSMEYYHNLFIHSPTDGHLGYLQVLAIVNTAAINVRVL